jgi:glycosyltransferase involved in cell wall biosynthesis
MPFAVLEMLSASMPVIAYDAPGPPVMLSQEYLVPRGDAQSLAKKAVALLRDRDALLAARRWSRSRSTEFTWSRAAAMTDEAYRMQLRKLRGNLSLHGS